MKPSLPLYSKVLFLAFLNLCLLGLAVVLIVRAEFRFDPGSFVLAPAQSRIMNVAHTLALELDTAQPGEWEQILSRYSRTNAVDLLLFDETGDRIAGLDLALPRQISDRLPRRQRPREDPSRPPNPPPQRNRDLRKRPVDRDRPEGRKGPDERTQGGGRRPAEGRNPADRPPPPQGNDVSDRRAAASGTRPSKEEKVAPDGRKAQNGSETGTSAPPLFLTVTNNPTRYWAGVRIPLRRDRLQDPHPGTLILTSPSLLASKLFFDITPWLSIGLAVILISTACWLPFIRGMTRSISQMTRAAGKIAEGHFEVHVADSRLDEIGQLGVAVNRMAARLAAFVNGQRGFLSGIAHELCNPIATIQFGLGSLERRVSEDQRDVVVDIQEEIQHMSSLVNELLSFSRAGMQAIDVKLTPVNVASTIVRVLGREGSPTVPVVVSVDEKLHVLADAELLFRAISNVVRNAIRYAGHAGPIQISAQSQQDMVSIVVADHGPGVPEEHLEDLFSPLYRLDPSRTQETGGLGLGLAIVRSCVETCGGTVRCRNRHPHGLEVEIRLPEAQP